MQTPVQAACTAWRAGGAEAGDLFWSPRYDAAEMALVLEPEHPLEKAVEAAPLAMVACAEALGAIAPPNLAITFRWPFTLLANGGRVGAVELALPAPCQPGEVPEALVIGVEIALSWPQERTDPGRDSAVTVLHEEGCGEIDRTLLLEAVARHFLSGVDGWEAGGFSTAHTGWLYRAEGRGQPVSVEAGGVKQTGEFAGLDEHGGIIVKTSDGVTSMSLLDAAGIVNGGGLR